MRIVRLSRASHIPPPPTVPVKTPLFAPPQLPGSKISRALHILTTVLLPPLLALALTLTLLPLLLPTVDHTSLSFFNVVPIGHARDLGIVALNGSSTSALTEAIEGVSARETAKAKRAIEGQQSGINHTNHSVGKLDTIGNGDEATDEGEKVDIVENGSTMEWLGKDGPRIHVGALQICSQNYSHPHVYCTSSSQAGSHTGSLPPALAKSLMILPTSPRTPILLLVSAILSVIATFVFLAGLIPWSCSPNIDFPRRKPPLTPEPHRTYPESDVDVETGSATKNPLSPAYDTDRRPWIRPGRPHGAFFCLIIAALGLASGALIELKDVHEAKDAWDEDNARAVGLVFELGALTYTASSTIHNFFSYLLHKCPADQDMPLVSARPVIKISPPADGPVGNGWAETPTTNPAPAPSTLSSPGGVRASEADDGENAERRNTFGTANTAR
ncbi:hypothetical protein I317_07688 [Kwoniella heveanensis CBS 569]|nr:hypothetical protein I317_07688 [Kwoniella heveanensis CBS 569]